MLLGCDASRESSETEPVRGGRVVVVTGSEVEESFSFRPGSKTGTSGIRCRDDDEGFEIAS